MNTARRHDLRENELARQIGTLPDTLRRYGLTIGLAVAAVVVVLVGMAFYKSSKEQAIRDAWTAISMGPEEAKTPEERIPAYLDLADKHVTPLITAMAIKHAGDQAAALLTTARQRGDSAGAKKYSDQAKQAYERLKAEFDDRPVFSAAARLGLAFLSEDQGNFAQAESDYKAIESDAKFVGTPFPAEAKHRLENLPKWKTNIVFAPPATRPASAPASRAANVKFNPNAPVLKPVQPASKPVLMQP